MSNKEILDNLVYLRKHLTNLDDVLTYLMQERVISENERDRIKHESTSQERNSYLLLLLDKKDWKVIRTLFLDILSKTNNEHCEHKIRGIPMDQRPNAAKKIITLKSRWWPAMKTPIKSLYKRKINDRILVEELKERISSDENQMTVLCESVAATKLSGLGGMGKTLTAKWFAHEYQHEYDHIFWMDCGEGSLLHSFQKLARDMEIKNRHEMTEVEELSIKCFEVLEDWKCLWIFDNAESYQGPDGIQKVLPFNKPNFHCLITSRSKEWGNQNGYGKISHLELDIFGENESLEFLKSNLSREIKYNEGELKELGQLLGNLPLGLQLAVATLNNGKMNLKTYIEKTSFEEVKNIVDSPFDDYEKSINKNMAISLESIGKKKNGEIAQKIMDIIGYLRPDDISTKFFMRTTNTSFVDIQNAISLLEKYSLITKTGKVMEYGEGRITLFPEEVEMDLLSIHRLLQQVIRYRGRKKEKETLRKIFGCIGFGELKFVPFTKFADESMKNEFPKVKRELLDQNQLQKLLNEKRFEDAVQLAKFIDEELNTRITKYNLAICMELNGREEEAFNMVDTGNYKIVIGKELTVKRKDRKLLELNTDDNTLELACFAFLLLQPQKSCKFVIQLCCIPYFHLRVGENEVSLKFDGKKRRLYLEHMSLDMREFVNVNCLHLKNVTVLNWEKANWNVTELILSRTAFVNKTGMEVQEMKIQDSPMLDISCLPPSVQKLTIMKTEVKCSGNIELPLLKFLGLMYMDNCYCLSHFNSVQLTQCHLDVVKEVNVDLLPPTVQLVKMSFTESVIGGLRKVDNLLVISFNEGVEAVEAVNHFQPNNLFVFGKYSDTLNEIVGLVNKEINKIFIGEFKWSKYDFSKSKLSKIVDKKSEYYLFEKGRGKAITKAEVDRVVITSCAL